MTLQLPKGTPKYSRANPPAKTLYTLAQAMAPLGGIGPVGLLDVQTFDGTEYHWGTAHVKVQPAGLRASQILSAEFSSESVVAPIGTPSIGNIVQVQLWNETAFSNTILFVKLDRAVDPSLVGQTATLGGLTTEVAYNGQSYAIAAIGGLTSDPNILNLTLGFRVAAYGPAADTGVVGIGAPPPITDYFARCSMFTANGEEAISGESGPLQQGASAGPGPEFTVWTINAKVPPDPDAVKFRIYFGTAAGAEDSYVDYPRADVEAAGWTIALDLTQAQMGFPPAIPYVDTVEYLPWLLQAGPFHLSRSMQSDIGRFVVQNISGDTIARDMSKIVTARAFEGAIFRYREFNSDAWDAEFEFHGRLSVDSVTERLATFSAEQMWNPSSYEVGDPFSETCRWEQFTFPCGSTPGDPVCNNTFETCPIRERFGGVLNTFIAQNQLTAITPTVSDVSTRQQYRGRKF